jgi:carbamoyltransferase
VRPARRRDIPATVHVDGSARPQAVEPAHNPRYAALLDRIGELTGVPVLVNTSFNLAGEPIVSSPHDAVRTFLASDIDALAVGNFLVTREELPQRGEPRPA